MNGVTLAGRLVLFAVFAAAGAAKLRDLQATRYTLEDFGLSARAAGPVAVLLPLAELAVAGLVLFDATAPAGVVGALVLLGAFIAAIAFNLARGRRPDCNCFGQLHSKPAGPATLARNGVLAVLAGIVLGAGQTDAAARALDDLAGLDTATALALAALVVASLALLLGAWIAMHLLRQHGRVLLRLDALDGGDDATASTAGPDRSGLPVGAPAPAFELATTSGDRVALAQLVDGDRPAVLAFVEPGCHPCRTLLPRLAERRSGGPAARLAVVITRAQPEAAQAMAAEHGLALALLDPDGSVADAYEAVGTPTAVAIGPDGLIASGVVGGPDGVRELLDGFDGGRREPGELVPDAQLEDLDGGQVSLRTAVAGAPHLVLFWSPTCGYCDSMLDDLRALERRDDLPPIMVIASGEAEANRAQGLRSRTLLDPNFAATGQALEVPGTPSALRLDAEGRIVSAPAVGVDRVLALAGAPPEALPLVVHTPTSA